METTEKKDAGVQRGAAKIPLERLVSAGMHPDLIAWEKSCGKPLLIGSEVRIDPSCEFYEPQYDEGTVYKITAMYVDSGGLNIGVDDGEGGDRWTCETDGYYIKDIQPVM